jgi:hypothetical protein
MDSKEQPKEIYEISVCSAKAGCTLTYRDVLDYLGYKPLVRGNAIRYGLRLTMKACENRDLPDLTAIIFEKATGQPSTGYPKDWMNEQTKVFNRKDWPDIDDNGWDDV